VDRQGESLCLGANEEEASGNLSGLAATILRAAFRSRIYVSNRETYSALNKALQKGGVHIRPHMTVPFDTMKDVTSRRDVHKIPNSNIGWSYVNKLHNFPEFEDENDRLFNND
jgi:hypothetical protein